MITEPFEAFLEMIQSLQTNTEQLAERINTIELQKLDEKINTIEKDNINLTDKIQSISKGT